MKLGRFAIRTPGSESRLQAEARLSLPPEGRVDLVRQQALQSGGSGSLPHTGPTCPGEVLARSRSRSGHFGSGCASEVVESTGHEGRNSGKDAEASPRDGQTVCFLRGADVLTFHRSTLVALIALTTMAAFAQPVAPLRQATPPGADNAPVQPANMTTPDENGETAPDQPREGHETERQTIAKCLADLATDDVNLRRRAAMILGKYRTRETQNAMIRCLQDPDDTVRQTALVALSESDLIAPEASKPIFRLLKDPNVHIRRIASSLLRSLRTRPIQVISPGAVPVQINPRATRLEQDPEIQELINAAIADEDAIVRKNALEFYPLMGNAFDEERLRHCLADPDREIRVLALRAYGNGTQQAQREPVALEPLVSDPEPIVRKELATALGWMGAPGVPLLERLAADIDPGVQVCAVQQLARLNLDAAFPRIEELLTSDAIPTSQRAALVPFLRANPQKGLPLLTRLAHEAPGPIRAMAVRALGDLGDQGPPPSFFLDCLTNSSGEVRRAAADSLRVAQPGKLTAEQITPLTGSPYTDVRLVALDLSLQLGAEPAAGVITECVLDDDIEVRTKAIMYAALKNVPGWAAILRQTLTDPSMEVQRAAVETLLRRRDPESRQILAEYAENCTVPELAAYLRARLQQLEAEPAQRPRPGNAVRQRPVRIGPLRNSTPAQPAPQP